MRRSSRLLSRDEMWFLDRSRTFVPTGMSAAEGALSRPMFEQLTTHKSRGPVSTQVQLPGHGLQVLLLLSSSGLEPHASCGLEPHASSGLEPHASRQHSVKSRLEKNPNFGTRTPCFRLDKVCPFRQGIAQSHLIALDGVSSLGLGRKTTTNASV